MGNFSHHLSLLMKKNWILQKRNVCSTLVEIGLPLIFASVLLLLGNGFHDGSNRSPTVYMPVYVEAPTMAAFAGNTTFLVLYTPDSSVVKTIMDDVLNSTRNDNVTVHFLGFASRTALLKFYHSNDSVLYSVEFNDLTTTDTELPKKLTFTLRPRTPMLYVIWNTWLTYPLNQNTGPGNTDEVYIQNGFLYLQRLVSEAIIKVWRPAARETLSKIKIMVQRMPYPPYDTNPAVDLIQNSLAMYFVISFMSYAINTTKGIVHEKERSLKETLKLMGLSDAAYWTSWFLSTFIKLVITMTIYAMVLGLPIGKSSPLLGESDMSLLYIFLILYAVAVISFSFMISVFVQKASVAAVVSGVAFCMFYSLNLYNGLYYEMSRSEKLLSSILFNMAMVHGCKILALSEGTGEGLQWNNFYKPATADDNFTFADVLGMLVLDSVLHFVLTWYVGNVSPGEFGLPKPWYFPLTREYWCCTVSRRASEADCGVENSVYFENEPTGMKPGIEIKHLKKEFGTGRNKKVAVENTTLAMYEGHITVLLGHNGAGKTTTLSVITGFIPPTSGTVVVNGFDILTDILGVRSSLGMCPQHNIILDYMTVQEHLEFFASLKGVPTDQVKDEVESIVVDIGLNSKRFDRAANLSGGQKRKLGVGIALIGGSKIVILDEPTSGMDPASRRQTWDLLKKYRTGRTLVLTTHCMDEADILGDRIAIMAEGVIRCCGTPHFLKQIYGAGYHLVIEKEQWCDVQRVTSLIQSHIPTSRLESEINAELSYLLPKDTTHEFAELLDQLETHVQQLGIVCFGTTATTMEEVFLKVGERRGQDDDDVPCYRVNSTFDELDFHPMRDPPCTTLSRTLERSSPLDYNSGYMKTKGYLLELYKFYALFVKKYLHIRRNCRLAVFQLLVPAICVILILSVEQSNPRHEEVPLTLDLSPFGSSKIASYSGSSRSPFVTRIRKTYGSLFDGKDLQSEQVNPSNYSNFTGYFLSTEKMTGTAEFNRRYITAAEFIGFNTIETLNISRNDSSNTSTKIPCDATTVTLNNAERRGGVNIEEANIKVTEGDGEADHLVAIAYYNSKPYHASAISLNYLMNAIARNVSHDKQLVAVNHPLPMVTDGMSTGRKGSYGYTIGLILAIGMAYLTGSFAYFLILERQVGAKTLQTISGVDPVVYWLSTLAWDYILYLVACLPIPFVFLAFQSEVFTGGNMGLLILILLFYGWSLIPLMYVLQFLFKTPVNGMTIAILINIMSGIITDLVVSALQTNRFVNLLFLVISPHHCLSTALGDIYINYMHSVGVSHSYYSWGGPGVGRQLTFLIVQGFVYLGIVLFVEYNPLWLVWFRLRQKIQQTSAIYTNRRITPSDREEDCDVYNEKQRILSTPLSNISDPLILFDLYKRYGKLVAVDHLTLGISKKECFGLLGPNGAGKTTTFKMLTGDVVMTGGKAFLERNDLRKYKQKVLQNIGYCPQFDGFVDHMTGKETLTMFARVRGVPSSSLQRVVSSLMETMGMTKYADKLVSEYSGGNKRKLSTAVALVGNPTVILLDEPSTGLDPKARRRLWNELSRVRASGKTLVLTSHSMEECDALCTRMAIMVNGRFVCLGSPQYLKNKFGQGYTLTARMKTLDTGRAAPTGPLVQFVQDRFSRTQVFDTHEGYAHFQLLASSVSLATVFTSMEYAKLHLNVDDYSVHQTTLEQVFLSFASLQTCQTDDRTSVWNKVFPCCCCWRCCQPVPSESVILGEM